MKKAYEIEYETMQNSIPVILSEEEQTWTENEEVGADDDVSVSLLWHSNVPGSHATEHVVIAAIQDTENMGYDVSEAEKYIEDGIKASENKDYAQMHRLASKIFHELNIAKKIETHPYWKFTQYDSFEQYEKNVVLNKYQFDINSKEYEELNHIGWVAQICGGALGTAIEGYTKENLKKAFGNITYYVRKPNTYNDDITYELAFIEALKIKGKDITSNDIAEQWIALVPAGWSAEDRALKNLKLGIFPPLSGKLNNPYREWIGAQMRGVVCGMVAPGNCHEAARLAYMDGVISHHNNGVLGEVFNAVLCSLAYVKKDIKEILVEAMNAIPKDSEYYSIIDFAYNASKETNNWEEAWAKCEKKLERYNWIHAYPNAAAEVIALYFGEGDFDKTMNIMAMQGYDVDCNAAQIATVIAIASRKHVDKKWSDPIGDDLITYMRKIKKISIKELAHQTSELGKTMMKE